MDLYSLDANLIDLYSFLCEPLEEKHYFILLLKFTIRLYRELHLFSLRLTIGNYKDCH